MVPGLRRIDPPVAELADSYRTARARTVPAQHNPAATRRGRAAMRCSLLIWLSGAGGFELVAGGVVQDASGLGFDAEADFVGGRLAGVQLVGREERPIRNRRTIQSASVCAWLSWLAGRCCRLARTSYRSRLTGH